MLLGGSVHRGDQVGAVAVRTEGDEISLKAVRALYAMTNARHFAETSVIATILSFYDASKVVGDHTHLTQIRHSHYDPRNEESSFRDSSFDRCRPQDREAAPSAGLRRLSGCDF